MMNERTFRIAILASGSGSNAEAIIHRFTNHPSVAVVLILSNREDAGVLARAEKLKVPHGVFTRDQFLNGDLLKRLNEAGVTHIVLAGFLWLVPEAMLDNFHDRIINIHPALLPKFGGKGMFGKKVHEAVLSAGEKETGITIHLANKNFDEGKILFQASCPVSGGDSAETITEKVQALEHQHYPTVIERWILNG